MSLADWEDIIEICNYLNRASFYKNNQKKVFFYRHNPMGKRNRTTEEQTGLARMVT